MRTLALLTLCSSVVVFGVPLSSLRTAEGIWLWWRFVRTSRTADLMTLTIRRNGHSLRLIEDGRQVFRFDTFGDEAFWGKDLRLHEAIAGQRLGGVGPGLSARAALGLGLKVDEERLPPPLVVALKRGAVNLDNQQPPSRFSD